MQEIIIYLVSKYGYISILLLIAIENIFPPIPSEVILCFAGFIAHDANLNLLTTIIFATLGSLIGALFLYYLGYILNKERILAMAHSKTGKVLRLNGDKISESIERFQKNGGKSVFFYRFVPIMRSLISIPAGISKFNLSIFLLLTTVGSLGWNTILILLGNMMGENWFYVSSFFSKYSKVIFILVIITVILVKKRKRKKQII